MKNVKKSINSLNHFESQKRITADARSRTGDLYQDVDVGFILYNFPNPADLDVIFVDIIFYYQCGHIPYVKMEYFFNIYDISTIKMAHRTTTPAPHSNLDI